MKTETPPWLQFDFSEGRFALEVERNAFRGMEKIPGRFRLECSTAREKFLLAVTALSLEAHPTVDSFQPVDLTPMWGRVELLLAIYPLNLWPIPENPWGVITSGWAATGRGLGTRGVIVLDALTGVECRNDDANRLRAQMANLCIVGSSNGTRSLRINQKLVVAKPSGIQVPAMQELLDRLSAEIAAKSLQRKSDGKQLRAASPPIARNGVQAHADARHGSKATIRNAHLSWGATIDAFCDNILGTAMRPAVFAGRDRELASLNAWANDSSSPPYLFLTSPGGYGKSALLVRWINELRKANSSEVIFFPISIRFGTNRSEQLFHYLAESLATIHGESVTIGNLPPDGLRDTALRLLSQPPPEGKRIIIVIDGLDEVNDWFPASGLFPLNPPPGLRILVTARSQSTTAKKEFLTQFGWRDNVPAKVLKLDGLSRPAVMQVLDQLGIVFDKAADQEEVALQLLRVSGGMPFLLRLHIDSLRERSMPNESPPDAQALLALLSATPAGLDGFLKCWLREQQVLLKNAAEEETFHAVLSILACAKGPLTFSDLQDLLAPFGLATAHKLRQSLSVISMLVACDDPQRGYGYRHPVLQEYFQKQLSDFDRTRYGESFITTGEKLIDRLKSGAILPEEASSYFTRNLGVHFEELRVPLQMMRALTDRVWMQAWYSAEGHYRGFLKDLQRVWRSAERDNRPFRGCDNAIPSGLGTQIRCALIQSSITSIFANIGLELFTALLEEKIWGPAQAQACLEISRDPVEQMRWLLAYVTCLRRSFPEERVFPILRRAAQLARGRGLPGEDMLIHVAAAQAEAGDVPAALGTANTISFLMVRGEALARISAHVPAKPEAEALLGEAMALIREPPRMFPMYFCRALVTLAHEWLKRGNITAAVAVVKLMEHFPERGALLKHLARWRACAVRHNRPHRFQDHEAVFQSAWDSTNKDIGEKPFRRGALFDEALLRLRTGILIGAEWNARDYKKLERLISEIVETKTRNQKKRRLREIRQMASKFADSLVATTALAAVANELPDLYQKRVVIKAAMARLPQWPKRATGLLRITRVIDDDRQRKKLVRESLQESHTIADRAKQIAALGALTIAAAEHGADDRFERIVSHFPKGPFRAVAVSEILVKAEPASHCRRWVEMALTEIEPWLQSFPNSFAPVLDHVLERNEAADYRERLLHLIQKLPVEAYWIWRQDRMYLRMLERCEDTLLRETMLAHILACQSDRSSRCSHVWLYTTHSAFALDSYSFQHAPEIVLDGISDTAHYCESLVRLAECTSNEQLRDKILARAVDVVLCRPSVCWEKEARAVISLIKTMASCGRLDTARRLKQTRFPFLRNEPDGVAKAVNRAGFVERRSMASAKSQTFIETPKAVSASANSVKNARIDTTTEARTDRFMRTTEYPYPKLSMWPTKETAMSYPEVSAALRHAATRERADLLSNIVAIAPSLFRLGGISTIEDVASSIVDVSSWWPSATEPFHL